MAPPYCSPAGTPMQSPDPSPGNQTPQLTALKGERTIVEQGQPFSLFGQMPHNPQFIEQVMHLLPGIVYLFDVIAYETLYINSQAAELLGYSLEEARAMGGKFASFVMHPEDFAKLKLHFEQLDRAAAHTSLSLEYRMRHVNGDWLWFISYDRVFSRTPEGHLHQVVGISQEITDRKRLEANLRQKQDLQEAIFNGSTDALFLVNPETLRTVDCNQRALELFEASHKSDLIDIEGHRLQRQSFTPEELKGIQVDMQNQGMWIREIEYITLKGNSFWGSLAAKSIYVGERKVNLVRVVDVTERKRVELALRESQQRYRELAEAMPEIVWTADAQGKVTYFNQRWLEYTGLSEAESLTLPRASIVHPDDREQTLTLWQESLAEQKPFEIEYRLRSCHGTYHWFICRSVPIKNAAAQVTSWIGTITDIDDLKQAQQAVAQSERQVRRVLDSLFSFVGVMTPEGILIEANRRALEAASLQPADVIGKPFEETYWWAYSPEIQAQLQQAIASARRGEVVRYDVHVRLGENQFALIDFALAPLLDSAGQVEYLIPSGIDITDRKQTENALRKSQAQLQQQLAEIEAIYQSAPIGLNVLDQELRFVRINQQLAEMNGRSVEEHLGRTVREVVPDLADAAERVLLPILETGQPLLNVEIRGETPAQPGVQRIWLEHFLPLKHGDQVIGISTVCEEITERKRYEAERQQTEESLRQNAAQLQQQTEQLAQLNRIKDEFLAVLSHELRTPLNPILGWAKLLQTATLSSEKTKQALAAIERNARLQVQLIDDLLDISRIIRGKLTLNFAPVSLANLIVAAIDTVHQTAEAKTIAIVPHLTPISGLVSGDAGRLQQVLWNLLSNAIKFTPPGGQVHVYLEQIASGDDGVQPTLAQITVIDTGKGISPDFLPYLFEMFRQQDSSTTRQFGGLGLGLAISRQLVEAHGGTITADSPGEGQGAQFTVTLPLLPTLQVHPSDELALPQLYDLRGIQLLIVDDEPDTLEFMRFLLEKEGATILTATSATSALNILAQVEFDVLISDIQMPEVDGYSFIRQVRSLPKLKKLPAIALTAYVGDRNRDMALSAGYQEHITKPIDPPSLIRTIFALVQQGAIQEGR